MLTSLEGRKIQQIRIQTHYLEKEEAQVLISFLHSPNAYYTEYWLKFNDTTDVTEALRAIKTRYSFIFGEIETKEPIPEEAEQLALEILDTHYGCSLYLNSELKALRSLEKRAISKYWW